MRRVNLPGAGVLTLFFAACSDPAVVECPVSSRVCETAEYSDVGTCPDPVGTSYPCEKSPHVEVADCLDWGSNPPQSGPHFPQWERERGEHVEPVDRGNWVHNLEHGWVVLVYNCPDGCDPELQVLRDVVAQRPDARLILTPDPLLDGPRFAAVAWTWVYETDAPELNPFLCFIDQHERHAPEDIP